MKSKKKMDFSSLYMQITTRCNMRCAHCAYSCTEHGEDISLPVVEACLNLKPKSITLGGGEPTIHPKFREIVNLCLNSNTKTGVVTNGKSQDNALWLIQVYQIHKTRLTIRLSLDEFHEPISPQVISAFSRIDCTYYSESRPKKFGRARKLHLAEEIDCFCHLPRVSPTGLVYRCSCPDAPTVNKIENLPKA